MRREHDHGDFGPDRRQTLDPGILSVEAMSGTRGFFDWPPLVSVGVFQPLDAACVSGFLLPFLWSRVSKCLLRSKLAEVKLGRGSFCRGGASAGGACASSSSSELDDRLRIDVGKQLHPDRVGQTEAWAIGGGGSSRGQDWRDEEVRKWR